MVEDEAEVEQEDEGIEVEEPQEVDQEGKDESEEGSNSGRIGKRSHGKCLPASMVQIEGHENVSHCLVVQCKTHIFVGAL
jgi:hypothetical protein